MKNLETEVLEHLEIEALLTENPFWEIKDFAELGYFVGPKNIGDKIELLLEEV